MAFFSQVYRSFEAWWQMFFSTDSDLSYVYLQYKSEKVHRLFGLGWKKQEHTVFLPSSDVSVSGERLALSRQQHLDTIIFPPFRISHVFFHYSYSSARLRYRWEETTNSSSSYNFRLHRMDNVAPGQRHEHCASKSVSKAPGILLGGHSQTTLTAGEGGHQMSKLLN